MAVWLFVGIFLVAVHGYSQSIVYIIAFSLSILFWRLFPFSILLNIWNIFYVWQGCQKVSFRVNYALSFPG